jgi:GNAT superfamily N-acetyltransferase
MKQEFQIRLADEKDAEIIAASNRAMAQETEHKDLDPDVVSAGVRNLIRRPEYGFYLVAERDGAFAGSLLITPEWSDWRNAVFWWVQSVYVRPEFRRQGVYRRLYAHVKQLAAERGNVCGFRLYVEKENAAAHRAYEALGMRRTRYVMYEEMAEKKEAR